MDGQTGMKSIMKINSTSYTDYGPIRTRDTATLKFYQTVNVSAWFSGCLTTTLHFRPMIPVAVNIKRPIVVVDVQTKLLEGLVPPDVRRYHVKYSTAIFKPKSANEIYPGPSKRCRLRYEYGM